MLLVEDAWIGLSITYSTGKGRERREEGRNGEERERGRRRE